MKEPTTPVPGHAATRLTAVTVDAYNAELRSGDGFVGDRASNRAFRAILDEWRERLREVGDDPLGEKPTTEISKKKLDKVLLEGDPEAAGLVQSAIEDFASELSAVTERFLKLKAWRDIERIAVGGGLRASRVGELAIGRASVRLKAAGYAVDLRPIHNHPDAAGLIGCAQLVPPWIFTGHDALLAVDVGGSNIRVGIVQLNLGKKNDFSASSVEQFEIWRHADEKSKPSRDDAVQRIGDMLLDLIRKSQKLEHRLAPFIGIACPGVITEEGLIERGGQNLPGNWESSRFNLAHQIRELVPKIGDHETSIVVHNDAVVQGLSEVPFMKDVERWGVLTIGTGLGNAVFTNREATDA